MDAAVAGDAIKRMSIGLTLKVSELSKKLADQAQWAIAEGVARPDSVVPDYSAYLDGGLLAEIHQS